MLIKHLQERLGKNLPCTKRHIRFAIPGDKGTIKHVTKPTLIRVASFFQNIYLNTYWTLYTLSRSVGRYITNDFVEENLMDNISI